MTRASRARRTPSTSNQASGAGPLARGPADERPDGAGLAHGGHAPRPVPASSRPAQVRILVAPQTAGARAHNPVRGHLPRLRNEDASRSIARASPLSAGARFIRRRRRDARRTPKVERVAELKARIEGSDALLLTEYRGLTVSEITELRRSLAEGGASFAVVKNTLMRAGRGRRRCRGAGGPARGSVGDHVRRRRPRRGGQVRRRAPPSSSPPWSSRARTWTASVLSADDAKALAELESPRGHAVARSPG